MTKPRPRTESELIDLLRSSDVRAPDAVHRKVETLIAARSPGARRERISDRRSHSGRGFAIGLAGTMAVVALVAVLIGIGLNGGSAQQLTLRQASALTLRTATLPAPAHSTLQRAQLTAAVDGVAFPYWEDRFGWRSTGERTDQVGGRAVTTVFYKDAGGRRIGYAIVAGTPAPALSGGAVAWRGGVPYRLSTLNGTPTVSWQRNGRLCVVSGRGVSTATLLRLASWTDDGAVST